VWQYVDSTSDSRASWFISYLRVFVCVYRSIRVIVRTTATFSRETEGFTQHVTGHFASHPQLVNDARDLNTDQIVHELNLAVEQFNARGSAFVLDTV